MGTRACSPPRGRLATGQGPTPPHSPRDAASDALGAEPENDPLTVENLAMTVYNQLGINGDKELMAPGSRPIEIVANGNVVNDLLA